MRKILVAILFVVLSFYGKAQSLLTSYTKISRPEKWWVITHPFVARRAWHVTQAVRIETGLQKLTGIPDTIGNGGKLDAFRHAYWMASLAHKIGVKKARALGAAHEKGNYLSYKKRKFEDGQLPDSLSGVMDKINNEAGLQLAKIYPKADAAELKRYVLEAIQRGQLRMLKHTAEGKLTDCSGEIISSNGKWFVPYCLITTKE